MSANTFLKSFSLLFILVISSSAILVEAHATSPTNPTLKDSEVVYVTNIQALRNLEMLSNQAIQNGTLVYVVGYYHSGDRGGGFFVYNRNESQYDKEDYGIHIQSNRLPGIWKRVNYERITVAYFGALGGDTKDDTEAFTRALDYLEKQQPPETLFVPKGVYHVTELILRDGVSIQGEFRGSVIRPIPRQDGSYSDGLIQLSEGHVSHIKMEGLQFIGERFESTTNGRQKVTTPMHCFNIDADKTNGGLWYASFRDVMITGFDGDGVRLVGGTDYALNNEFGRVNQFINFDNVRIHRSIHPKSRALYIYGQNAQFSFIGCNFDGYDGETMVGTNVHLESNSLPVIDGYQRGPQASLITFQTCVFQNSDIAIEMHGTYNINVDGCWFENIQRSIVVTGASRGISINRNKFSNAGHTYLLMLDESWVAFKNNVVRQKNPVSIIKTGKGRKYFGEDNYHEIPGTSEHKVFN